MDRFSHDGFDFDVTDTPAAGGTATGEAAVLLHGFPEDRHSWDAVTPALTAGSWYMVAFQLPVVPELLFSRRGRDALRAAMMRGGLDRDSADRYAARSADPAAIRGPLNWYRALPFSVRDRTGPILVPTLFLRGDGDTVISRTAAELCGRYVTGRYRYEVLAGASHWLPEEVPDRVAPLLVQHFGEAAARI